jgi:hypothetical protein
MRVRSARVTVTALRATVTQKAAEVCEPCEMQYRQALAIMVYS